MLKFLVGWPQTEYNKSMEKLHIPVLLSETLDMLKPARGESYLDLTAGYGGHASEILTATQNYKNATLIDRDEFACEYLREKFQGKPVTIVNENFYDAAWQQIECGNEYDIILADFGISSVQVDRGERGFSFMRAGELDMRMDRRQKLTAAEIVNRWSERELTEILEKYGELSKGLALKMARKIVRGRPFDNTLGLAEALARGEKYTKRHPATQVFQAIRITVNDELGLIEKTLPLIPKLLKPGGRVALITFHSLEDRIVKQFFREMSERGEEASIKVINKSPIVAGDDELVINPRARSAKLRGAVKLI